MDRCQTCFNLESFCTCNGSIVLQEPTEPVLHTGFYL